jgi:hypothetical protein
MSSKRNVIRAHLDQFLNGNYTVGSSLGFADENPMYNIQRFCETETSSEWTTAANVLQALINKCNTVGYPSGTTYRIVATLTDGTVWFDSNSKKNTYANFKAKDVNENHNTRRPYMESLLHEEILYPYESKVSTSTGLYEERVVMRIGGSKTEPLGCIGLSARTPN